MSALNRSDFDFSSNGMAVRVQHLTSVGVSEIITSAHRIHNLVVALKVTGCNNVWFN